MLESVSKGDYDIEETTEEALSQCVEPGGGLARDAGFECSNSKRLG